MPDLLENQTCPFCLKKTLTLLEDEKDIPFFGNTFIFSMTCSSCSFHKSDLESAEDRGALKITFTSESEEDLKVRVVKSSAASIKIPTLRMSVQSTEGSNGYITNIEGVITRFEKIVEAQRDTSDDKAIVKSAKNLLKKIRKVKYGDIPCKIVIEDKTGNSAIISEKAIVEKKGKKKKS
jgi:zinc finger protein